VKSFVVIVSEAGGYGQNMWHEWAKSEMHKGFRWERLKERHHLASLGIDGRIILKWIVIT
jgi:hypothetical protein